MAMQATFTALNIRGQGHSCQSKHQVMAIWNWSSGKLCGPWAFCFFASVRATVFKVVCIFRMDKYVCTVGKKTKMLRFILTFYFQLSFLSISHSNVIKDKTCVKAFLHCNIVELQWLKNL